MFVFLASKCKGFLGQNCKMIGWSTCWVIICSELIQIALFRNVTTTKSLHVLHAAVVPTSFNCSRSTFERMSMLSKLIHTCPHSNMNVVVAFFKNSLTSQVNNFTTSQLCTIHLCICNWCSKQIIDLKIWEFLLETQNWNWSLDYFWNSNRPNCKDIYWKIAPFNYEKISVTYHFILVAGIGIGTKRKLRTDFSIYVKLWPLRPCCHSSR